MPVNNPVEDTGETMSKSVVRTIFAAVLLFFAAGVVATNVDEPYPALILPGFPAPGDADETRFAQMDLDVVFVFDDGDQRVVSPQKFFGDAPRPMVPSMARWFDPLPEDERGDEYQTIGTDSRLYSIFPGLQARRDRYYEDRADASMRDWMHQRSDELFAGEVIRVEFVRHAVIFEPTESGLVKIKTPADRRVVELES